VLVKKRTTCCSGGTVNGITAASACLAECMRGKGKKRRRRRRRSREGSSRKSDISVAQLVDSVFKSLLDIL